MSPNAPAKIAIAMNPSAKKAIVDLSGGPLDGHHGYKTVINIPGKFPVHVHPQNKKRYVYQAAKFMEDVRDGEALYMTFVQILLGKDEL